MKAFETKDQSSYIFNYLAGSVWTQFMGDFWLLGNEPTSFYCQESKRELVKTRYFECPCLHWTLTVCHTCGQRMYSL